MRVSVLAMIVWSVGTLCLAEQVEAQPSAILPALAESQSGLMERRSVAMPAPSLWDLIGNPSVQVDLELVDDQLKQVEQLRLQMVRESKQLFSETQGVQDYDQFAKSIGVVKRKYVERLENVLLPLQIERMKQIALQIHLKRSGMANAITSSVVAEVLGLSDQQVVKLKEKSLLLKDQLAADIQKLKAKRDRTLLNELTAQQRTKLIELQGDKWASKPEDWSQRLEQIRRQEGVGAVPPQNRLLFGPTETDN